MEENQNYGQQPYGGDQQYNQQPYGDGQQQYNQQPYGGGQQPYNQQAPYAQPLKPVVYDALPNNHGGVAVAALVCGIMGIVFFWFPGLGLILNIAGLVCAIITLSKKYDSKGMAIGGLVTSIIGLLLSLYMTFCYVIVGALLF